MKKYLFLTFLIIPFWSFAQTILQGKVSLNDISETFTAPGVSVYWEGSSIGTVTDDKGTLQTTL